MRKSQFPSIKPIFCGIFPLALLITLPCFSESTNELPSNLENINPDPNGEPWIVGGISREEWDAAISQMPALARRAQTAMATAFPYKIDNTTFPAFRPIFNQNGGSCAQASSIGYVFTYELNYQRGLPADALENQYPYDFTYNFLNRGSGSNGSMPDQGWKIAIALGIPNAKTYGGFGLGAQSTWKSGYPIYYNAMANRVASQFKINVATADGINQMKQWLFDHQNGAGQGGCLVFAYDAKGEQIATIPTGLPEAGKKIMPMFGNGGGHAVTIAGYNDSVRYDYNKDGRYTNNVDQNNDGRIDVKDWEIGAYLMVNSWGASFGNSGKIWIPYRMCAQTDGIWSQIVYGMETQTERYFKPLLTYKVTLSHSDRSQVRIRAGYANSATATVPNPASKTFSYAFNYSGGTFPMQGTNSNPIEIGLDVSDFVPKLTAEEVSLFLQIDSKSGAGNIASFSVLDYSGGETPVELVCAQKNVNLPVGTTTLKILKTLKKLIVMTPNGGEKLEQSRTFQITWFDRLSQNVKIELLKNNTTVSTIAASAPSRGVYDWLVPADQVPGTDYKIKISSLSDPNTNDVSDNNFTIRPKSTLELTSPNSGNYIEKGKTTRITWNTNISGDLKIELFKDKMLDTAIATVAANTGAYTWSVPTSIPSDMTYSIRITNADNPLVFDDSDNNFSIVFPIMAVPYAQNFENFAVKANIFIDNWEQAVDDDFDWTVYSGKTPSKANTASTSGGTGPDGDHTTTTGKYVYMEASNPNNPVKRTTMLSPMFNTENSAYLQVSFWCHMYSRDGDMGQLYVDLFANGVWRDSVLFLTGDQGDRWFQQTIEVYRAFPDLSTPISRLQVRMRGITGTAYDSDICIDDFKVTGLAVLVGRDGIVAPPLKPRISMAGNSLQFRNIQGTLNIYSLNGKRLQTAELTGIGIIDIATLPRGAYIAKAGHAMLKFIHE
jgi:hypothetical protein